MRFIIVGLLGFALWGSVASARGSGDCPSAPLGLPTVAGTELVCHAGYASLLDPSIKETRLVEYQLTAAHSVAGCIPRTGLGFKPDPLAPAGDQGKASDYAASGYDLGHMADNENFAWDKGEQADTFSMANVSPQLPGLNRQGWEQGENFVRAWAYARGGVVVFIGPIFGQSSKTIGGDKLRVPSAFFKVVYDPATKAVLSFEMPQQAIAKPKPEVAAAWITSWIVPLAKVQSDAGFSLPIPTGATQATAGWPADFVTWGKAHKAACAK